MYRHLKVVSLFLALTVTSSVYAAEPLINFRSARYTSVANSQRTGFYREGWSQTPPVLGAITVNTYQAIQFEGHRVTLEYAAGGNQPLRTLTLNETSVENGTVTFSGSETMNPTQNSRNDIAVRVKLSDLSSSPEVEINVDSSVGGARLTIFKVNNH